MEILGRYLDDSKLYHNTLKSMGTRMDIILCGMDARRAEEVFLDIQRLLVRLEGKLSWYREDSEITRINIKAFGKSLQPDPEVMTILSNCAFYHERTGGYFDPTLRKLQEYLLGEDRRPEKVRDLKLLKERTGWKFLELDEQKGTVRFLSEELSLDLGGYGKGYALQKIKDKLTREGIRDALISFGESSVLAMGRHPHGSLWRLGIQNAFDPSACVHTLDLSDQAMSTSGLNPNNLRGRAHGRGHLIDPHSARALSGIRSLTVLSRNPVEAEVLSTALILAPLDEREEILARFPGIRIIDVSYNDQNIPSVLSFTN